MLSSSRTSSQSPPLSRRDEEEEEEGKARQTPRIKYWASLFLKTSSRVFLTPLEGAWSGKGQKTSGNMSVITAVSAGNFLWWDAPALCLQNTRREEHEGTQSGGVVGGELPFLSLDPPTLWLIEKPRHWLLIRGVNPRPIPPRRSFTLMLMAINKAYLQRGCLAFNPLNHVCDMSETPPEAEAAKKRRSTRHKGLRVRSSHSQLSEKLLSVSDQLTGDWEASTFNICIEIYYAFGLLNSYIYFIAIKFNHILFLIAITINLILIMISQSIINQ